MLNTTRSDEPHAQDPRYQRRIVAVVLPIIFVSNMFDVTLECGHAPLVMAGTDMPDPAVGDMMFCPDCYAARNEACQ